jgi:hypothetical protein
MSPRNLERITAGSISSLVGWPKRRLVLFFLGHCGAFRLVHGVFVLLYPTMFPDLALANPGTLVVATAALAAYHAISYLVNYVDGAEFEHVGPVTLTVEPYWRTVVLHVAILLGAAGVAAVGAPAGALVVMVLVETVLGLRGHWREHDRALRRGAPPG